MREGAPLRPAGLVRTVMTLSYRNDHDAAISRIGVLEHELATSRDQATRDQRAIAMLQRELAEQRRQRDPPIPRRTPPPPDRLDPAVPSARTLAPQLLPLALILTALVFVVIVLAAVKLTQTDARPVVECSTPHPTLGCDGEPAR
jgi:hypothetical protein